MAGKLIEFPRKLEWKELPCWVGFVKGTQLLAKVERAVDGNQYQWVAFNDRAPLGMGLEPSLEEAQDAARKALETGVMVVRPLAPPQGS